MSEFYRFFPENTAKPETNHDNAPLKFAKSSSSVYNNSLLMKRQENAARFTCKNYP
jgi:hypothetical protein